MKEWKIGVQKYEKGKKERRINVTKKELKGKKEGKIQRHKGGNKEY
jgi:hypothetical protein